jgi:hypothetical protein
MDSSFLSINVFGRESADYFHPLLPAGGTIVLAVLALHVLDPLPAPLSAGVWVSEMIVFLSVSAITGTLAYGTALEFER